MVEIKLFYMYDKRLKRAVRNCYVFSVEQAVLVILFKDLISIGGPESCSIGRAFDAAEVIFVGAGLALFEFTAYGHVTHKLVKY